MTTDSMAHSGTDIHDALTDDAIADAVADGSHDYGHFESGPEDDEPTNSIEDFIRAGEPEQFDSPDEGLLQEKKRSPTAKRYERKARGLFSTAFRFTASVPQTVPDSAAILMHGPDVSEKLGDLAAENAQVARMVDMITDGTENPGLAFAFAAIPFALQLMRNHEPALESKQRGFRIPFTKREWRFTFGVKLGRRMRGMTNDPHSLTEYVYSNPEIQQALAKTGITVAR